MYNNVRYLPSSSNSICQMHMKASCTDEKPTNLLALTHQHIDSIHSNMLQQNSCVVRATLSCRRRAAHRHSYHSTSVWLDDFCLQFFLLHQATAFKHINTQAQLVKRFHSLKFLSRCIDTNQHVNHT